MSIRQYLICPVSEKRINEKAARLTALFTVVLLLTAGATGSVIPLFFLTADFYLRSSGLSGYSPLALTALRLTGVLRLKTNLINAGPKIFAARIGLTFSVLIILSVLAGFTSAAYYIGAVLSLFSFLESAFGICVACEIYPFLYKLLYRVRFE